MSGQRPPRQPYTPSAEGPALGTPAIPPAQPTRFATRRPDESAEQHTERLYRGYARMSQLSARSRNPQDYD